MASNKIESDNLWMAKTTTMATQVGTRLARAREAVGLDQAEFARRLNITAQRLNNWETGDAMVPPTFIPKIFLITRIDASYLYQGDLSRLPGDLYERLAQT